MSCVVRDHFVSWVATSLGCAGRKRGGNRSFRKQLYAFISPSGHPLGDKDPYEEVLDGRAAGSQAPYVETLADRRRYLIVALGCTPLNLV